MKVISQGKQTVITGFAILRPASFQDTQVMFNDTIYETRTEAQETLERFRADSIARGSTTIRVWNNARVTAVVIVVESGTNLPPVEC
jgi:hypothetical protein